MESVQAVFFWTASFRPMLWAGPLLCVRAKPCGLRFRKEAESAEKARKPAKIKSSFGCSCLDNKSGCYPYGKDSGRFCSENIATQKEQHPKRCCPWCGRGDSPSRALKTVRRTVFARRDANGGHRLFKSSLATSRTISYKIKRAAPKRMLLMVRPGGFEPLDFGVGEL